MDDDELRTIDFIADSVHLQGLTVNDLGGWPEPDDEEIDDDMRDLVLGLSPEEREEDNRKAQLLAGVLWNASIVVVDQLFEDLLALQKLDRPPTAKEIDETWVLSRLPQRYAHRYGDAFAKRFIAASIELFLGLSRGWRHPSCVAQELAVWCLLDQVELTVELYGLDVARDWRAELSQVLLEDLDSEMLFDRSLDGIEDDEQFAREHGVAPMAFDSWFTPFNAYSRLGSFVLG